LEIITYQETTVTSDMENEKIAQEASNILHSIMKGCVSKTANEKKDVNRNGKKQ
jgi:hypothetical protein